MKKTLLGISLLSLLLSIGCTEKQTEVISVDPASDYPKKEYVAQDFLQVSYVPLETNDEFVTQGRIFCISDHYIVAGNWSDGNIYFFDRETGAGKQVINRKGQSGEEYNFANAVVVDEKRGELFVNDASSKRILVYDLTGKFKRKLNHIEGTQFMELYAYDEDQLISYDISTYYLQGKPRTKEANFYVFSKEDGSLTREIPIPFEIIRSPLVQQGDFISVAQVRAITPDQEGWILSDTSADTLYRFRPKVGKLEPFIANNSSDDPYYFVTAGVVTDDYCFMNTVEKKFDFATGRGFQFKPLVYEFATRQVYEGVVLDGNFEEKQMVMLTDYPLNQPDLLAYQTLPAAKLVEAYQDGKLKGEAKEVASHLDEEDNPVVVLYKRRP